jgi:hypothetical protein
MEEMATQVRSYASPGWIVGNPSMIRSPISKLGLDANSVIHRGLNSLFVAKIAFGGLN